MGICGGIWQGPIRLYGDHVLAIWRCPEGDASSRWLIDIRTDLFLPPTITIAATPTARAESDPLAELARLIGQTDPFGAAAKAPHPLQSRANVRPQL